MLKVAGLNAFYGRAHILHDVAFDAAQGETLVVLGRNGAGKSTLFKTLMGLVRPASGTVLFAGQNIAGQDPHRIARAGIGWVPEDRRIFTDLTTLENLEVGRRPPRPGLAPPGLRPPGCEPPGFEPPGLEPPGFKSWTPERLFALFPNLAALQHRPGNRMSGGEQQMLAIARTLMGNPTLLLLDEPSEGLSPLIVEQMAAAIRALRHEGVTILLAEQNLHFATAVADRAVILESGHVAWSGSIAELQADPRIRDTLSAT